MNRTININKEPDADAVKTPESESAFQRWSRRKHDARVAARHEISTVDPAPAANVEASDAAPERALTDADMPPVESLDEHSDYSPFMSPGVSEALRQTALRRLFQSPQLNVLCELEGEFFDGHGFKPLGNIVTHEMRAALERELEKAKSSAKERLNSELTDPEKSDVAVSSDSSERVEPDSESVQRQPEDGEPGTGGDA